MCKHHYHPSLEHFSSFQTETLYPVNCPHPAPGHSHPLLSVSMNWTTLSALYKWTHKYLSSCEWLISLSIMFSGFIHIAAYVRISFLLIRLNSILLYLDNYTVFTHLSMDTELIPSLAMMNNATVSMYIQISESLLSIPLKSIHLFIYFWLHRLSLSYGGEQGLFQLHAQAFIVAAALCCGAQF